METRTQGFPRMEEGGSFFCHFVFVSTSLFAEAKLQHGAHRIELWIIHREHTLLEFCMCCSGQRVADSKAQFHLSHFLDMNVIKEMLKILKPL